MSDINISVLTGNMTRDPQVRYIQSGTAVAEFGLAVNRTWFDRDSNQKKEKVAFIDITCWARLAELVGQYGTKGRQVCVKGYLEMDTWTDKESGQKRSKLKVVADEVKFLGSPTRHPESQEPRVPQEDVPDVPSSQGIGEQDNPEVPF
jgi:single-strand DNA-binding protein